MSYKADVLRLINHKLTNYIVKTDQAVEVYARKLVFPIIEQVYINKDSSARDKFMYKTIADFETNLCDEMYHSLSLNIRKLIYNRAVELIEESLNKEGVQEMNELLRTYRRQRLYELGKYELCLSDLPNDDF